MTKTHPSQRLQPLAPHFFASLSSKVAALVAAGSDVIRLDEGSPDLPPAPHIIEALDRAAASPGSHSYQPHRGIAALRSAWSTMYQRDFRIDLNPETEILPLLGSKEGIFHLSMAWLDPGDLVLIPDPGYITYTRGALFAGAEPYYLPLHAGSGYLPDLHSIPHEAARRARILWLNYPNNPTSAIATLEFFSESIDFARKWDLLVCHDAAYTRITYDGYLAPSILQVPGAKEVAVEFNTLSKTYNMAGWRVAAAAGNPQVLRALFTLKTNQDSGQFLPIMEGATAALTGDQQWIMERNQIYRERRDIVIQALHELGLPAETPQASLYIWTPIPAGWSSIRFCQSLLEEAFVSLTPGTVFGTEGEGYVRISLTADTAKVTCAMRRLREWTMAHRTEAGASTERAA